MHQGAQGHRVVHSLELAHALPPGLSYSLRFWIRVPQGVKVGETTIG